MVQAPDDAAQTDDEPLPFAFRSRQERRKRWPPLPSRSAMPPVVVSVGRQTHLSSGSRKRPPQVYEYEGFIDRDNPAKTYARWPGSDHLDGATRRIARVSGESVPICARLSHR